MLHDPMGRLRAAVPGSVEGRALLDTTAELFGLAPGSRSAGARRKE